MRLRSTVLRLKLGGPKRPNEQRKQCIQAFRRIEPSLLHVRRMLPIARLWPCDRTVYGRIVYRRQCSLANTVHDGTHARDTESRQDGSTVHNIAALATALVFIIGHMLWPHDPSRCIPSIRL
jgi:hypothetical protein